MRKLAILLFLSLLLAPGIALAHHPTEDILDAEIYEAIDDMVSDTPHADLFIEEDEETITTTVTTDFTSTADSLIQQGMIEAVSQLDGDVTMVIEFDTETEVEDSLIYSLPTNANGKANGKANRKNKSWKDWGGKVTITIIQVKEE